MLLNFNFSTKYRRLLCVVLSGALLCCLFIGFVDKWASRLSSSSSHLRPRPAAAVLGNGGAHSKTQNSTRHSPLHLKEQQWEEEYQARVDRIRQVCEKDEIAAMRKVWRVAANRRWGKDTFCKSHMCPIIVDEAKVLFFCTVPSVASTRVKEFFLNISNIHLNKTVLENPSVLHEVANTVLHRVSPMFFPASTARRLFKILFVRHPFDRLASAFRSKVESSRDQNSYFYDTYWNKVMVTLRGRENVSNTSVITFPEFVWYLKSTLVNDYDEHWTPYSSRCDPCLVDYDFIGKLETAEHDFPYAFGKVEIESPFHWWNDADQNPRSVTLSYFAQLKESDILDLYKIYRTDFMLFGYTLDDFIASKTSNGKRTTL